MLKINRNSVVFDKTSHHFRPLFAYYESIRYDLKDLVPQFIDSDEWGIRYDINHQQRDGLSPLHISVTSGQVDMVKYFLSRGADFNLQDKQGFSSLHKAAWLAGHEPYQKIFEILLRVGADPTVKNNNDKTPVEVGATEEVRSQLQALVDNTTPDPNYSEALREEVAVLWAPFLPKEEEEGKTQE